MPLQRSLNVANAEARASARLLYLVSWILLTATSFGTVGAFVLAGANQPRWLWAAGAMAIVCAATLGFLAWGQARIASIVLPVSLWLLATVMGATGAGIHDISSGTFLLVVLIAGTLHGARAGQVAGAISGITLFVFVVFEYRATGRMQTGAWMGYALYMVLLGAIQHVATASAKELLGQATHELSLRQRMEAELRQSEERHRSLIESQGEGIGMLDRECRFLYANPAAEEIFGAPGVSLAGRLLGEFVPGFVLGEAPKATFELQAVRDDGTRRTLLVTASFQTGATGEFLHRVMVFRDLTEPRKLEERLRLLVQALRSANDIVCITDGAGVVFYVNDALLRAFGYREDEILGQRIEMLVSPNNRPEVLHSVQTAAYTGGWRGELWLRGKDGHEFLVALSLSIIRDERGKQIASIGVSRDITAAKRVERDLREAEAKFHTIFEMAPDGIFIVDASGRFIEVNEAACQHFGYSKEELLQRTVLDVVPLRLAPQVAGYGHEAAGGAAFRETCHLRADGTEVPVELHIRPLTLGGQPAHVGIVRNIAERQRMQEETARLEEQLRHAQKMESIGRLAGGVAHDFNNLLTVINGYSDYLLARLKSGDAHRPLVEEIRAAGKRAETLTQQLLTLSRKQIVAAHAVNLNELVTESEGMFRRLIGEDIELVTLLGPSLGTVMADPGQLHQVLMNLVVNARDAMPDCGKLYIETANVDLDSAYTAARPEVPPGPYILLAVTDTGTGMDEQVRERIFEPFFTTKPESKGTGLGLSTVYGIVRQSDGFVWVYSEPGKGTTFKVYLPRIDAAVEENEEAEKVEAIKSGQPVVGSARAGEQLLLVEDQDRVRKLARTILESRGFTVLEAAGGAEALVLAAEHTERIDLLVTDVVMPGMNGRELAERLVQLHPETGVLYTSGYTSNVIAARGVLEAGFEYLPKPYSADSLVMKIREILDRRPS
jgi:two-component system, cell cycle sensor histidine kinase and response regulator CckA